MVANTVGLSRTTIHAGLRELAAAPPSGGLRTGGARRVRAKGGGRQKLTVNDPTLLRDLDTLVEPTTRGDPQSPLRWTCKSTPRLAKELVARGHAISQRSVCDVLAQLDYSLQAPRKIREGGNHADRDARFGHIAAMAAQYQAAGDPVVSVDTKKKELIGDFKNGGREWQPQGTAEAVRGYDFIDPELGKVAPYGVDDVGATQGWVSVGITHDTAELAVESIRRWWREMGQPLYPAARRLPITADCGGSNGYRVRLWKVELQKLADDLGMIVQVCHFPPGTSKWNKIEHRLFSQITENWRGRPLVSHEAVVNLIAHTTTQSGLYVRAELDEASYPTGIVVTDEQMQSLNLEPADFHGRDWNYTLHPRSEK